MEEKAYLIGFRLGDLNVYHTNQVVVIRGSTTKPAQAKLIFDFLLPKHDGIESWIKNCPRCFLSFFAGYFDAEGCITFHKSVNLYSGGFEIQSYDKNIIYKSWKNLNKLEVICPEPYISKPRGYISSNKVKNNGDTWRLSIFAKKAVWQLLGYFELLLRHGDKIITNKRAALSGPNYFIILVTSPFHPFH